VLRIHFETKLALSFLCQRVIISSNEFGNLTRHADLILYVLACSLCMRLTGLITENRYTNDSVIIETDAHEAFLRSESSDYARLWCMQAEAFL
jgi:hypothetical protein